MATNLLILRHGNTFAPGETPLRVGARTNLPLVESGLQQAHAAGRWLKDNGIMPDVILSGPLLRHTKMAEIITQEIGYTGQVVISPLLNELDYGPDEAKPEDEVIARVGESALHAWNTQAIVPPGWPIDVDQLKANWATLAQQAQGKTVLLVTSNGTARFALSLLETPVTEDLKLGTGRFGWLKKSDVSNGWQLEKWNIKPTQE